MKAMERPAEKFLESLFVSDLSKVLTPAKKPFNKQSDKHSNKQVARQASQAVTLQRVHCPTCGSSHAERYHEEGTIRTQCSRCDYLMTICIKTGRVMEAYAPSFTPAAMSLMA